MYKKIGLIQVRDKWSIELGFNVPDVITQDNQDKLNISTKIICDENIDTNSDEYKQMESVAEVLKAGFDIGCSYTSSLFAASLQQMESEYAKEEKLIVEPDTTSCLSKESVIFE